MRLNSSNSGFTIIELMIATVVLATLLIICAAVSINIGRLFYKGISSSRTQEASRNITAQIAKNIQYSGQLPVDHSATPEGWFCVGRLRYSYRIDQVVAGATHAMIVDNDETGNCSDSFWNVPNTDNSDRELVPGRMRLTKVDLERQDPADPYLWNITIGVALGDDTLFVRDGGGVITGCISATRGGQFCDVAELNTAVYRRLL